MKEFNAYKSIIASALKNNSISKSIVNETRMFSLNDFEIQKKTLQLSNDLIDVAKDMGIIPFDKQQVGMHPDFKHLKNTNILENHNIVSTFIDIKGSTNLFRRYDNQTVYIITNTIQLVAIHVCKLFGGFIHRLQGDGLFVYFGGKGVDKKLSNLEALTALSFFTYFIENDIKDLFEEEGIEKIKAKIGIDFGDDENVLWASTGIDDSSEVTTISLHTSLASKMQQFAGSNEIVIGQNVIDFAKVDSTLFEVVAEQRYIFQDREKGLNYTQYKFNWLKFLKQSKYIVSSPYDNSLSIRPRVKPNIMFMDSSALKETASINKPWCK